MKKKKQYFFFFLQTVTYTSVGTKELLSEIKFNILADAISAVSIMNVLERNPNDNNIQLYITTDDLKTVNSNLLADLCTKYTTPQIYVSFLVPIDIYVGNKHTPNTDSVCIFIEKWN